MYEVDALEPDEILGEDEGEVVYLDPEQEQALEVLGALEPEYASTVGRGPQRFRGGLQARRRPRRLRTGARRLLRAMGTRGRMRGMQRMSVARKPPFPIQEPAGAPPVSEKQQALPFTSNVFTVASQAPVQLIGEPQAQFRPERIVTLEVANAGAVTDGVSAVLTDIKVGTRSEFVGAGVIPFSTFEKDAFGVRLLMDGAGPGIKVVLFVSLLGTLATAGATLSVACTMIGDAIQ
jgi:hypothetical protein